MATKAAKPAPAAPTPVVEAPVPKVKSKKKKLLLVFSTAVLLLGAGGAAGWYAIKDNGPALSDEEKQLAAEQAKKAIPPVFVSLEPFVVNLRGGDDSDHYLQLGVVLQVSDEHATDAVKQQMPRIRNSVLMLLSSKSADELSSIEGKQQLSEEIVTEARKPMQLDQANKGIEGVYFSAFVIQ
jgi:flagellar FliL protein